ncbi:DUF411 domain-containing protein [Brevundimonas sp. S30B]|jgi:hypothetical protein|uniref:DUF411 domain-containing protein n=1 Tax=unclassified Brevundimonas TaxID=2622653 RepID=UPI001072E7BF|nr:MULTISPECIES: DUF411 domain-containing protein [unclassified Brevundimonas]QBX37863.1 DUF411 domain-containing protein [Brevundimonas sp. MF30-B]TFW02781.1 DUF411 domain-containing protein [Brevundimonas sp. S30B]
MKPAVLTRRLWLAGAAALVLPVSACAQSRDTRTMQVFKTPTCGCCDGWVRHMQAAGFVAEITELPALRSVRSSRGVPEALASCHTAVIGGYAIEGHVPAADVQRLLRERPRAVGLAVPAMPLGSPGMETPDGRVDPYETLLILPSGQTRVFARHGQA